MLKDVMIVILVSKLAARSAIGKKKSLKFVPFFEGHGHVLAPPRKHLGYALRVW